MSMSRRFTASSLHSNTSNLSSSQISQQSEVSDYSQESVHIPCQFQYGEEVVEYDEMDPMLEGLEDEVGPLPPPSLCHWRPAIRCLFASFFWVMNGLRHI